MNRLAVAAEAVRHAALLAREIQDSLAADEAVAKQDRSPVTVADFAVQALISLELAKAFPQDPILGEEDATFLRSSEGSFLLEKVLAAVRRVRPKVTAEVVLDAIDRCALPAEGATSFWTLDPVDGTKGFLRRSQFAIALAYLDHGTVQLGVLGCPNLPATAGGQGGSLFQAQRGRGGTVEDLRGGERHPLRVQEADDPRRASFLESVEAEHSAHGAHAAIAARLGVEAPPVRMDSQAKYGSLARGEGSIYLRLPRQKAYQEKIWDHAAGSLVVTEAGGRVTDALGRDLDFSVGPTLARNTGIIATNGKLHDRVLEAVAAVVPPPKNS